MQLGKLDIDGYLSNGSTPLMEFIKRNYNSCIMMLLQHDIDCNKVNKQTGMNMCIFYQIILHLYMSFNKYRPIISNFFLYLLLIGQSPLHLAILHGNDKTMCLSTNSPSFVCAC